MSYDLMAFFPSGEAAPLQEARQLWSYRGEPLSDADSEERRRTLAADLLALDAALVIRPGNNGFPRDCWIGIPGFGAGFPHIDFSADAIDISFSYFGDSEGLFGWLQLIVEICAWHGYETYDAQLDDLISAQDVTMRGVRIYRQTNAGVRDSFEENP